MPQFPAVARVDTSNARHEKNLHNSLKLGSAGDEILKTSYLNGGTEDPWA